MKKLFPILLLACALAAPAALTAASFEGKVHMQVTASGKKDNVQEMDYSLKDGLVRIDMQAKDKSSKEAARMGGIIMDPKKQEMTVLMPSNQMYMVMSLAGKEKEAQAAAAKHEGAGKPSDTTLEKTGETETILGYKCEKYVLKTDKTVMNMWITDEIEGFMGMGAGAGAGFGAPRGGASAQPQAWEKALAGKGAFPMRVIGMSPDGKENFRMEVTAIDKSSQPAANFEVPAGWRKFEMPNIGDMMKGMMPGGSR